MVRRWRWAALLSTIILSLGLLPAVATATPTTAAPLSFGYIGTSKHACTNAGQGQAACTALIRTDAAAQSTRPALHGQKVNPADLGNDGGYDPSYLQSAYNLTSLSQSAGVGQTVAIVDAYDDPNVASDLNYYRQYFGLPACTSGNGCFSKINQNGGTSYPAGNSGWAVEISLDVDMVSAICPNCHILLVEANSNSFTNLLKAVDTAVNSGAKYVSMSWAGSDSSGDASYDSHFDKSGIAFTAASGDSGYGAEYPAASPYVTSVGGTTLNQLTNTGTRDATETAWSLTTSKNGTKSGTGSGCSTYEPQPAWQSGTGSACTVNGTAHRSENDVAAVADPNTPVQVYDTYGESGSLLVGGTSAATPIIASVYALAGQPGANDMPGSYPYGDPSALNDITSGSNGSCGTYICNAGVGYDGPTGLGTPNGVAAFQPHGSSTGPTPVVSSLNPTSGSASTTVTIYGSGFTGASAVDFGSTPASSFTFVNDGQIKAVAPAGSGTVDVTVTTQVGTSATSPADQFTYTSNAGSFSLSATPGSRSIRRGRSTTYSVKVNPTNGFSSAVTLSVSGLPNGASASFSSNPVSPGNSSTLRVQAGTTTG
ncbi:MAG TPA: IPT/TIG domain-containing protein, partial [Thermomicrobiaceae bacterium]|nr:IPT/TIG domain-containing protein [Thermomicrobiaceae bacterium]